MARNYGLCWLKIETAAFNRLGIVHLVDDHLLLLLKHLIVQELLRIVHQLLIEHLLAIVLFLLTLHPVVVRRNVDRRRVVAAGIAPTG